MEDASNRKAGADPAAVTTVLLSALDRAGQALQGLALQASRTAAFHVLSGAERTGERVPWLRARAAALHERGLAGDRPAPPPEGWAASWSDLSRAAETLSEGVDALVDGADEAASAGPAPRLERLREALDVIEERLARFEASGSASSR